jgi:hypothetical protein
MNACIKLVAGTCGEPSGNVACHQAELITATLLDFATNNEKQSDPQATGSS